MSFVDFKEISVNNPGTSIRYGGDDLKGLMQILNGKTLAQKRPKILNEWIWLDHFDMTPPAIVPGAPTDTNASRIYIDPTDFKAKVKKTDDAIRDIENIDIPETALLGITSKIKIPAAVAYEDEANIFTELQTVNKAAQAAAAETIQLWKVSDGGSSQVELRNASSTDGEFAPWFRIFNYIENSSHPGLYLYSHIAAAQDVGGIAALIFDTRKTDATAITTRPLFDFRNAGTSIFKITPTAFDFTNKTLTNAVIASTVTGIVDANISAHTTTKITTLSKSLLNTAIAYNDQANTYGDFDQVFRSSRVKIRNPTDTFSYILMTSAIAANRNLTIPLLTTDDILVTEAFTQTLTNKTLNALNNTITNLGDAALAAHTSTKITITAKGQLNSLIMYEDEDNNLGDHYLDVGDIVTPANPALGVRRMFADSANGSRLSVLKSDGTILNLEAGASINTLDSLSDVVITSPVLNQVPTWDGTNWVNATPPGQGGGEANTGSNIGTAGVGFHKQKTGVDLEFYKLNALSSRLSLALDTTNNKVDIDVVQANLDLNSIGGSISTRSKLPTPIIYDDEANTYGDFLQIFRSGSIKIMNPTNTFGITLVGSAFTADRTLTIPVPGTSDVLLTNQAVQTISGNKLFSNQILRVRNPAATFSYIFNSSAISADINVTLPLLTANDTFVFQAFSQPLTNKTIDASLNTLSNIGDAAIAATGITTRSKLPATLVYDDEANTWGDFNQIFLSSRLLIQSPSDTPTYIIAASSITANRTATLPLLATNDTFVMALHPQTLEGKTISGGLNILTDITDAAISSSGITTRSKLPSPVAYEDEINVFTTSQTFNSYQEDAKITPPANPGLEAARRYFKQVTSNLNTYCIKQKINGAIREVRAF